MKRRLLISTVALALGYGFFLSQAAAQNEKQKQALTCKTSQPPQPKVEICYTAESAPQEAVVEIRVSDPVSELEIADLEAHTIRTKGPGVLAGNGITAQKLQRQIKLADMSSSLSGITPLTQRAKVELAITVRFQSGGRTTISGISIRLR